jgi:hypothetical protein
MTSYTHVLYILEFVYVIVERRIADLDIITVIYMYTRST